MRTIGKVNHILIILIFITLFFLVLGISYSFFYANLIGVETEPTIDADAGEMTFHYETGPAISAKDIAPSTEPFATKNVTITANNTTVTNLYYQLKIQIYQNTFSSSAISYTLTGTNNTGNGTLIPNQTTRKGLNYQNEIIDNGSFIGTVTNAVHSYEIKFYFYETDYDQLGDLGQIFNASIVLENYEP